MAKAPATSTRSHDRARRSTQQDGELFFFLCEHVSTEHEAIRRRIESMRTNLLTIMSFCFLGEGALLAAITSRSNCHPVAFCFAMSSIAVWLTAFSITLFSRSHKMNFHVIPGNNDGFDYLPLPDEVKTFANRRQIRPFDADTFFMTAYLNRASHKNPGSYCVSNQPAREGIPRTDSEQRDTFSKFAHEVQSGTFGLKFNKNAWFAQQVHMLRGEIKNLGRSSSFYKFIYALFVGSIILMLVALNLHVFL